MAETRDKFEYFIRRMEEELERTIHFWQQNSLDKKHGYIVTNRCLKCGKSVMPKAWSHISDTTADRVADRAAVNWVCGSVKSQPGNLFVSVAAILLQTPSSLLCMCVCCGLILLLLQFFQRSLFF